MTSGASGDLPGCHRVLSDKGTKMTVQGGGEFKTAVPAVLGSDLGAHEDDVGNRKANRDQREDRRDVRPNKIQTLRQR
jgi:hypothetical protein